MSKQYPAQAPPAYGGWNLPSNQAPITNIITQTAPAWGPLPQRTTCPNCNESITTYVEDTAVTKTHLIALVLCLIGCLPCVCVPYCMKSCQGQMHYCPKCNHFIGERKG